jgi:hypothetical protein
MAKMTTSAATDVTTMEGNYVEVPMPVGVTMRKKKPHEVLRENELVLPRENKSSAVRSKSLRLNLLLPGKSASRLEKLKELTEASSYTEVIRNAIRFYEAVVLEYERGNKVQIVDKNGHPTGITIF